MTAMRGSGEQPGSGRPEEVAGATARQRPRPRGFVQTAWGWLILALACAAATLVTIGRDGLQWSPSLLTLVPLGLALFPLLPFGRRNRRPSVMAASPRLDPPPRDRALVWLVAAGLSLALGIWVYTEQAPHVENLLAIELSGASQIGGGWPPPADLGSALRWDFAFIVGYGTALWMMTTAATWVFWTPRAATLARFGRGLTVLAVVADVAENVFLATAWTSPGRPVVALDAAAVAATIKFAALLPAALVALTGVLVLLVRIGGSLGRKARKPNPSWTWTCQTEPPPADASAELGLVTPVPLELAAERPRAFVPPNSTEREYDDFLALVKQPDPHGQGSSAEEQRWRHAYGVPGITAAGLAADLEGGRHIVGVALSGGGVRSASVCLGALQTLREVLLRAKYLVSVSGGSYTAGALVQLLTDAQEPQSLPEGARPRRDASGAYQAGTVEFNHVHRHSSYLSATASETVVALGVLARGLVASLALLFAPAVGLGVLVALYYHFLPGVSVLPGLPGEVATSAAGSQTPVTKPPDADLSLPSHDVWAVVVTVGGALLLWLLQLLLQSSRWRRRLYGWSNRAAAFATRAAVVVGVVAVGVPVLLWLAGRIISLAGGSVSVGVGSGAGVVLLSYLASLAAVLWRKRTSLTKALGGGKGEKGGARAAVPRGLLQLLFVLLSLVVLVVFWLLLLGVAAAATVSALTPDNSGRADLTSSYVTLLAVAIVVVVIGVLVDESSLSLHPFYRRRLATAFATRRVSFDEGPPVAVPYSPAEGTKLSTYGVASPDPPGAGPEPARFPEVIFAAAANLTGEHLTAPGLTAVSFTMNRSWCGGPDVGWVRTTALEAISPPRLGRDVTVQAAVAISGAAVASAMGRFARWYQVLLAVSGARLGAWLPNPLFLLRMRQARDGDGRVYDWTMPGLPRIRRVTYLLREVFNLHSAGDRLLQITDGGHYENLGIVELLRRRCTVVYCVDGGGDTPPAAQGLAEAIRLAEAELGVEITLHEPWKIEPGSGTEIDPKGPLTALNSALSQTPIVTGTIRYPAASGLPEDRRVGFLCVGRALLWRDMPYALLAYAAQHPEFPRDSTSDQWFDNDQFTAYTELGREVGQQMAAVAVPKESRCFRRRRSARAASGRR